MEILKLKWKLHSPVAADINDDGLNDLMVVNNPKARIDLLCQKRDFSPGEIGPVEILNDDVNDIFGREKTWRFKRFEYDLDVEAGDLVIADLNGDGLADMAYCGPDGLRVVCREAATDDAPPAEGPREPQWAPPVKIDVESGKPVAADLNGDGRTDLAILSGTKVFIVYQGSDGTMAQPVTYAAGARHCADIFAADLDGDGRRDLVLQAGDKEFPVVVRFQGDDGSLGPEKRYRLPAPRELEVVSFPGARADCLLSVSAASGRVRLSALTERPQRPQPLVLTYPLGGAASDKRDVAAADVDGDGLMDVVVSDPARAQFLLFRATAERFLTSPKRFEGLAEMSKLVAADLDGDRRDAVVALSIKEKTIAVSRFENGRLRFPVSVAVVGEPVAMDLADLNGDGRMDLVYVSRDKKADTFSLRSVLDVGRPNAAAGSVLEIEQLRDAPADLRIGDMDRDGRPDVLIVRSYGPILLIRQPSAGEFAPVTGKDIHAGLVANVERRALSMAPLGPDGATAALLAKKNYARAVVFDADGRWRIVDQYQSANQRATVTVAAACRLGDDGELSLVTYDRARGRVVFFAPQEDGTYRTDREVEAPGVAATKIVCGEFGGGAAAVLLCGEGKLVLVPVTGSGRRLSKLASYGSEIKNVRYGAMAVGDVNGDGVSEVLVCDHGRRQLEILAFGADGRLVHGTQFKVFDQPRGARRSRYDSDVPDKQREPRSVLVGDFTGDGKSDVVLHVHDRIIIYPQD